MTDFFGTNRANWDDRAALHAARDGTGYRVEQFIEDRWAISEVVRFDLPRLGDISGVRTVHLQCHIGTDTISLARLGATVTGLGFSGRSIEEARRLASETGDAVDFVQADVRDAAAVLSPGGFDLVYTGVGALCWLPDIDQWAKVVATLLAPGGVVHFREGHPILWEIITAILDVGLRLEMFVEHDSVPWEALPGQMTPRPNGEWALTARSGVAPLSYTLRARKPRD